MSKQKCNNCGARYIKNPIWKGQEHDVPFSYDKIIWKNIFKVDWFTVMFLGVIIFLAWSYTNDIEEYKQVYEDPCGFVKLNQEACYQIEQQKLNQLITIPGQIIIDPIS